MLIESRTDGGFKNWFDSVILLVEMKVVEITESFLLCYYIYIYIIIIIYTFILCNKISFKEVM